MVGTVVRFEPSEVPAGLYLVRITTQPRYSGTGSLAVPKLDWGVTSTFTQETLLTVLTTWPCD
jgi:hypothetical protein